MVSDKFVNLRAWTNINVMTKLKYKLDRNALEIVFFFSFIRPIVEYACIIGDICKKKVKVETGRIVSGTNKLVSVAVLYEELG